VNGIAPSAELPISAVGFEIFHRPSLIRDFFVLNGLTLIQSSQAGPFDRQEMHGSVTAFHKHTSNEPCPLNKPHTQPLFSRQQ
jgi:hypothetical protein